MADSQITRDIGRPRKPNKRNY